MVADVVFLAHSILSDIFDGQVAGGLGRLQATSARQGGKFVPQVTIQSVASLTRGSLAGQALFHIACIDDDIVRLLIVIALPQRCRQALTDLKYCCSLYPEGCLLAAASCAEQAEGLKMLWRLAVR